MMLTWFLLAIVTAALNGLPAEEQPAAGVKLRAASSEYVIGPGDELSIQALNADEVSTKGIRVDPSGTIHLPMIGVVPAAGRTVEQLEAEIVRRLSVFLRKPEVAINLTEMRNQSVSVLGAVNKPGIYPLQGNKTLVEVLSLAGGLRQDAGHSIKITRRRDWGPIPLPNAATDKNDTVTIAAVSVKDLMEAKQTKEILIRPQDVISVPIAEMVYVVGDVGKAGGFVLNERETITVVQALSLAQGLGRTASPRNAKILRPGQSGAGRHEEIAVCLNEILSARAPDVEMHPGDILFVPSSGPKRATTRAIEAAIQAGTGILIWRR